MDREVCSHGRQGECMQCENNIIAEDKKLKPLEESLKKKLKEMDDCRDKEITELKQAVKMAHKIFEVEYTQLGYKFMKLTIVKRIIQEGEKQ